MDAARRGECEAAAIEIEGPAGAREDAAATGEGRHHEQRLRRLAGRSAHEYESPAAESHIWSRGTGTDEMQTRLAR